jgi:hypothetical protein
VENETRLRSAVEVYHIARIRKPDSIVEEMTLKI